MEEEFEDLLPDQSLIQYLIIKNHRLFKSVVHTASLLGISKRTLFDRYKKQGPIWDATKERLEALDNEHKDKG